jgi:hypothetical protein
MNIVSIDETRYINSSVNGGWDIFAPSFTSITDLTKLNVYEVQRGEEMRIDLVMKSIYDDPYSLKDLDVVLYINNIDNPLNIREGMLLYYPEITQFINFRYYENSSNTVSKSIKSQLGVLNKTTRKDENRKKFLDANYSLPPTVMKESKPAVTISNGNIFVGGL